MATLLQIAQVCTGAPLPRLAHIVPAYNAALPLAGATTPLREAMFLAQVAHESGEFHYSEELWGPTPAQFRYEGSFHLGNTQPGDGLRFKGRGWIQLTGRLNYTRAGVALGMPLVDQPGLAAMPLNAGKIAAWFWVAHSCNAPADLADVLGCTRIINGGTNGLQQREAYYTRACAALGALPPSLKST